MQGNAGYSSLGSLRLKMILLKLRMTALRESFEKCREAFCPQILTFPKCLKKGNSALNGDFLSLPSLLKFVVLVSFFSSYSFICMSMWFILRTEGNSASPVPSTC